MQRQEITAKFEVNLGCSSEPRLKKEKQINK